MNARQGWIQLSLLVVIMGLTGWGATLWADPAVAAGTEKTQSADCDKNCTACDRAGQCDQAELTDSDKPKTASSKAKTQAKGEGKADARKAKASKNKKDEEEKEDPRLKKLKEEAERLSTESRAASARLEAELRKAKEEIQRLQTQMELESTRQRAKLAKLEREKAEIQARMEMDEVRMKAELTQRKRDVEREAVQIAIKNKALENELAVREREVKQIKADLAYRAVLAEKKLSETALENQKLAAEAEAIQARMNLEQLKLQQALAEKSAQINTMNADVTLRTQRENWQEGVNDPLEYSERPFRNGKLVISDRRIELNGVIWDDTAKQVTERIHFYNNQSQKLPIFIVIDESPGGSVASGAQILQAMKSSKAPIHVVVKRFAASMAAVITTLAEQSYAYPNAMLLHHQPSSGNSGNTTQQKEGLEMIRKWEKRFAGPVAEKMGLSIEEFREQMYENNSNGDWIEFADGAQKLRWVDHLVTDCHELSVRKKPENSSMGWFIFFQADRPDAPFGLKADQYGKPYFQLPPLTNPFDAWFIHNPRGFYRP